MRVKTRMTSAKRTVTVRGSGVAALTAARLLDIQGWNVRLEGGTSVRRLHLLLSETTANLLEALWNDSTLLAGAHPIHERAVQWGRTSGFEVVPAVGTAIGADELVKRLATRLHLTAVSVDAEDEGSWIVDARAGSPETGNKTAPMRAFGRRHAWVSPAVLRAGSRADRCMMEAVESGWIFLLPVGNRRAILQFVSFPSSVASHLSDELLAETRTIRSVVDSIGAWSDPIACMPRAMLAPASAGRIAIGEAALSFDPISGDGVGHALRGVVLAVTILQEIADGMPIAERLNSYASTLHRAMVHHLTTCLSLYREAPYGDGWREELCAMQAGVALLTGKAVVAS